MWPRCPWALWFLPILRLKVGFRFLGDPAILSFFRWSLESYIGFVFTGLDLATRLSSVVGHLFLPAWMFFRASRLTLHPVELHIMFRGLFGPRLFCLKTAESITSKKTCACGSSMLSPRFPDFPSRLSKILSRTLCVNPLSVPFTLSLVVPHVYFVDVTFFFIGT